MLVITKVKLLPVTDVSSWIEVSCKLSLGCSSFVPFIQKDVENKNNIRLCVVW
jgi:hypothetical protein